MAPLKYLNATCDAEETLNFAYIDLTTFNETTCAIAAPGREKWWDSATIVTFVFVSIVVLIFVASMSTSIALNSLMHKLHILPSYRLHEEVEDLIEKRLIGGEKRKFDRYEKGRYRSVATTIDEDTQRRTVTIVEDMTKKPLSEAGRSRMPRVPRKEKTSAPREAHVPSAGRGATATQTNHAAAPAPGMLGADVPLTNVASSAPAASQAQAPTGSDDETAEIDIGASPPPYTHQWKNFV